MQTTIGHLLETGRQLRKAQQDRRDTTRKLAAKLAQAHAAAAAPPAAGQQPQGGQP